MEKLGKTLVPVNCCYNQYTHQDSKTLDVLAEGLPHAQDRLFWLVKLQRQSFLLNPSINLKLHQFIVI